jgi:hypothetical protein
MHHMSSFRCLVTEHTHLCRVEKTVSTSLTLIFQWTAGVQVLLPKIHATLEAPQGGGAAAVSADAREKQAEVQAQLCGVLQVIIQKLIEEEEAKVAVAPYADAVSGACTYVGQT